MKKSENVMKKSLGDIFKEGGLPCRLSFILFGAGNIGNSQIVKGILFLLTEIAYIVYMIMSGVHNLAALATLGENQQGMTLDEKLGIYVVTQGDNSMLILLWGVVTAVITVLFLGFWYLNIRSGYEAHRLKTAGRKVPTFLEDIKSLANKNIHVGFMTFPLLGILVFTIMPLIYMILMAFTNYDAEHQPPGNLFDWVGLANFRALASSSGKLSATFWPILGWTLIWGFVATFSCYFLGMFLAMLINSKGIKLKKMWRTVFVMTMAIPVFISLLVVGTMLGKNGIVNVLLQGWGFSSSPLPFLTDGLWAKCTVIVVNLWIGIPSTMIMVTGILMNIPAELYESAHIDGAGPVKTFLHITFPYMIFVTTPYLITQLIGNFNNFGVIYFLTEGQPNTLEYYKGAGRTDLLVTWLYKLTKDSKDYNLAATIGIVSFIISATFSLISYTRSNAVKNEEGFM
ncbi:carbohydrate ABC transporter permease [Butyrivibrio sp. MC2013]|uniref:carbohydrate ABC transporter permease n=1 Tax=Butyrivibrio sp. MC2013 TaxID=1280686 RepID=UPI000422B516|nr:sugar ABC transporter permease [Butyrivibrio sp. MC2013]